MVVAEWISKLGLEQVLAPDQTYAKKDPNENDTAFSFYNMVAPDPKFSPPPKARTGYAHYHETTPRTPQPKNKTGDESIDPALSDEVLQAGREARMMIYQSDKYLKVLVDLQANLQRPNPTRHFAVFQKKLQNHKSVEGDKFSLRQGRTFYNPTLANEGPGLTLLHLAAKYGNVLASRLLLEEEKDEQLKKRDPLGSTALHIAAYYGRVEAVKELKPFFPDNPVDIIGHTAFASSVTSPTLGANKNRMELESSLYLESDPVTMTSSSKPIRVEWADLGVVVATADVVGKRITTEDSCNAEVWKEGGQSLGVVSVCDGHGDKGLISKFIADNLHYVLQKHKGEDWKERFEKASQDLDDELKTKYPDCGGSTAVSAVVTSSEIIVGNVGDSRCILIQRGTTKDEDLTQAMSNLSLDESQGFTVTALSNDHDVIGDELERLKQAGASIVAYGVQKNGTVVTKHKLRFESNDKSSELNMSRSFGDFEFKVSGLICTPEVQVQKRDFSRDAFLVLACDGCWNVKENEEVARIVMEEMSNKPVTQESLEEVANRICKESITSGDNITVAILALGDVPRTEAEETIPPRTLDAEFASPDAE